MSSLSRGWAVPQPRPWRAAYPATKRRSWPPALGCPHFVGTLQLRPEQSRASPRRCYGWGMLPVCGVSDPPVPPRSLSLGRMPGASRARSCVALRPLTHRSHDRGSAIGSVPHLWPGVALHRTRQQTPEHAKKPTSQRFPCSTHDPRQKAGQTPRGLPLGLLLIPVQACSSDVDRLVCAPCRGPRAAPCGSGARAAHESERTAVLALRIRVPDHHREEFDLRSRCRAALRAVHRRSSTGPTSCSRAICERCSPMSSGT